MERAADLKTKRIMLSSANQQEEGFIVESMNNFPCDDLKTLDQLWLKYSDGKFGFSVQNDIFQSLGGTREHDFAIADEFGNKVGWKEGESWLRYEDIIFDLSAPEGHLPLSVSYNCWPWCGNVREAVYYRAEACDL
ncbi:MAG: GUN4 domain-containing protein [Halothece sp.]